MIFFSQGMLLLASNHFVMNQYCLLVHKSPYLFLIDYLLPARVKKYGFFSNISLIIFVFFFGFMLAILLVLAGQKMLC